MKPKNKTKKLNKTTGLKIKACAILNEDKPEFFVELLKKGVDAVEPEMEKQLKEKTKTKIEQEECKECQICKLNNPKHPICNYHQGYKKGRQERELEILNLIKEDFDKKWISYYKLDGGKVGVLEKTLTENLERLKKEIIGK